MKLVLLASGVAAMAAGQSSKIAIDNDQVKVLQVDVQAHAKTKLHEHKVNRVMIYQQPGRQTIDFADGRKTVLTWAASRSRWL